MQAERQADRNTASADYEQLLHRQKRKNRVAYFAVEFKCQERKNGRYLFKEVQVTVGATIPESSEPGMGHGGRTKVYVMEREFNGPLRDFSLRERA